MKTLLALLLLFCLASRVSAQLDPFEFETALPPEKLQALIRATALRVEEALRDKNPDARDLGARVDELLALPEVEKKDLTGDRAAQLAYEMSLASYNVSATASVGGIRGHLFDVSTTGRVQLYRDLEKQTATDDAEVRRWLQMRKAAEGLKWNDEKEMCHERAVGAARAFGSREPKNATAHALLAFALDWREDSGAETLAALREALRIDPKHPLAQVTLLSQKIEKAVESAAFRRAMALEDKSAGDRMEQIYHHSLSEEELHSFERELDKLGRECADAADNARDRRDFAAYMLATDCFMQLRYGLHEMQASHRRSPETTLEEFTAQVGIGSAELGFGTFQNVGHVLAAVELAGDDAEALGSVALIALAGRFMVAIRQNRSITEEDTALVEKLLARLVPIANADDSLNAARACEAICVIGLLQVLGGKPPSHPELLLRAVQLDPFRHRNLNFLVALAMTLKEKRFATAGAVVEIQLAVLPNASTRRQAAAVAARLHEWDRALRHLDAAAKEAPDDHAILAQRVATLLQQSQSQAAIKKAGLLLRDFNADNLVEKTASMTRDERAEFFNTFILHQLIARHREVAEAVLKAAIEAAVYDRHQQKRVREWMEK